MKIQFLLLMAMLSVTANANAATISFTGTIGYIEIDDGSSIYSGVGVSHAFYGGFIVGDSASDASSIDIIAPTATGWL